MPDQKVYLAMVCTALLIACQHELVSQGQKGQPQQPPQVLQLPLNLPARAADSTAASIRARLAATISVKPMHQLNSDVPAPAHGPRFPPSPKNNPDLPDQAWSMSGALPHAAGFGGNQSLVEREAMLAGCHNLSQCGFMAPSGFDELREPPGYEQ